MWWSPPRPSPSRNSLGDKFRNLGPSLRDEREGKRDVGYHERLAVEQYVVTAREFLYMVSHLV